MIRYLFELLAFLEKNGRKAYSIRDLSDNLFISSTVISNCVETAVDQGWITQKGQEMAITDGGLSALEPYRVKRAIILAAGFGSRMMPATSDRPKPMVTVKGVRIIDTLLDALTSVGITDITVIGGYQYDKLCKLQQKYPFIKLIDANMSDPTIKFWV